MRAIALLPVVAFCACFGDDNSSQPPPPGPPPAPAAVAPDAGAAAAVDPDAAPVAPADAGVVESSSRVPTAADMLGLGRRHQGGKSGLALPAFLQGGLPEGQENPLFKGQPVEPSQEYEKTLGKTNPIDVSPIERHWGAEEALYGSGGKPGSRGLAGPAPSTVQSLFGSGNKAAPPAADAKAASTEAKFRITLYRLNPQSGQVETFDRAYTTADARDAAKDFKAKEGFKAERPSQKDLDRVAAAKAAREASQKKPEAGDAGCKFKASWSTGEGASREMHSRCFATQAEVDRFTAERQRSPSGTAPAKTAKEAPEPAKEKPAEDPGALKPVPIGAP